MKRRMIAEEEMSAGESLPLIVEIIEQFVKDNSLDKLLLKKLNNALLPYHEEKGELLKIEPGRVINDVSLLENTTKHVFLYMKLF